MMVIIKALTLDNKVLDNNEKLKQIILQLTYNPGGNRLLIREKAKMGPNIFECEFDEMVRTIKHLMKNMATEIEDLLIKYDPKETQGYIDFCWENRTIKVDPDELLAAFNILKNIP